jgi:hypothetical protein
MKEAIAPLLSARSVSIPRGNSIKKLYEPGQSRLILTGE